MLRGQMFAGILSEQYGGGISDYIKTGWEIAKGMHPNLVRWKAVSKINSKFTVFICENDYEKAYNYCLQRYGKQYCIELIG